MIVIHPNGMICLFILIACTFLLEPAATFLPTISRGRTTFHVRRTSVYKGFGDKTFSTTTTTTIPSLAISSSRTTTMTTTGTTATATTTTTALFSVLPRILLCDVPNTIIPLLEEQYKNQAVLDPVQGWSDDQVLAHLLSTEGSGTQAFVVRSANTVSAEMIKALCETSSSSSSSSEHDSNKQSTTTTTTTTTRTLPMIRVIGRAGVGLDNIDCIACEKANITVVTAAGANALAVAEHAMALIFALARKIKPATNSIANGKWMKPSLVGIGIRGKTLGIVGFGAIGLQVAMLGSSALGMNILIAPSTTTTTTTTTSSNDDSDNDNDDGVKNDSESSIKQEKHQKDRQEKISRIAKNNNNNNNNNISGTSSTRETETLNELLELSDFVSVQLPLTDTTRGYIGANELNAMKSSAMLVSVGRGGVVDEKALLCALENKTIAGAALDVFENEGPGLCHDETLMKLAALDSTVITPHVGGHTQEAQADVWACVIRNVLDALSEKTTP